MSRILSNIPSERNLRIAIADASGLIYSDDYRSGWVSGFTNIGCDVKVFDIGILGKLPQIKSGPYSHRGVNRTSALVAKNLTSWHPDLVFCHHGRAASRDSFLMEFRRVGVRTAVYLCDEPYECGETVQYAKNFDFVFTMDPCTMHLHSLAKRGGERVFYLPPGVDTARFEFVPYSQRNTANQVIHIAEACFLGNATLVPRPEYLRPLEAAMPGAEIRYWTTVGKGHKDWIPLEDHPRLYSRCVLGLNVHRHPGITVKCFKTRVQANRGCGPKVGNLAPPKAAPEDWGTGFWNDYNLPASHVNPRFFEFAACGTCVINDNTRFELFRMFPMAPRADSPDQFVELALYYLEHRDEAQEIGKACHDLILRRHTYSHRAAEVLLRVGLRPSTRGKEFSSLGEPKEWLTTQDCNELGVDLLSGPTGHCEPFDRHTGIALMRGSGGPRQDGSLRMDLPWLH